MSARMHAPADVFQSGQRFLKYLVRKKIGAGGMGEVYLVEDTFMQRELCLKVLPVDRSDNPLYRERMQREAVAGSRVRHVRLVQILDGGITDENIVYLVMEYLANARPLADLVHQAGPFTIALSLTYAAQIAEGVAALHAARILHRDLKPGNVLVLPGGSIKIIDYGLARIRTHALRTTVQPTEGGRLGTAHYMSPEQIYGDSPVDEKTDVYSMGCIVFEMLTGKHVFQAATDEFPTREEVTLRHQFADAPRLEQFVPAIPKPVAEIVARMLSKEPAHRPTADEARRAFAEASRQIEERAAPRVVSPPPRDEAARMQPPDVEAAAVAKRRTERLAVGFVPADPRPVAMNSPSLGPRTEPLPVPVAPTAPADRLSQPTPGGVATPLAAGATPDGARVPRSTIALGLLAGFAITTLLGILVIRLAMPGMVTPATSSVAAPPAAPATSMIPAPAAEPEPPAVADSPSAPLPSTSASIAPIASATARPLPKPKPKPAAKNPLPFPTADF